MNASRRGLLAELSARPQSPRRILLGHLRREDRQPQGKADEMAVRSGVAFRDSMLRSNCLMDRSRRKWVQSLLAEAALFSRRCAIPVGIHSGSFRHVYQVVRLIWMKWVQIVDTTMSDLGHPGDGGKALQEPESKLL